MNLTKLKEYHSYVCLFVGKSGSGKSTAIASFANEGPLKIYDLDRRARGILGSAEFLGEDIIKQIEIEVPEADKHTGDLWKALVAALEIDLVNAAQRRLTYKTIAYESATTIADLMLLTSKRLRGAESKSPGKQRGEHVFTSPDDYNYVSSVYRDLFYEYLLPLKVNVILSAWVVDEWGPNPEGPYLPDMKIGQSLNTTRKLAERIPGYFDEIYYFSKQETAGGKIKYFVQFEGWLAKTAIPALKGLGKQEITDKNFFAFLESKIGAKNAENTVPKVS